MQEALGDVALHPWDLWEYTLSEYLARRKGRRSRERREYQQIRQLALCALLPHLKKGAKPDIDVLVPDMYDEKPAKARKSAKEIIEIYKKAGILKDGGEPNQNNSRGPG